MKSLGGDGEIGLPEISGRRINIEDSCGCLALSNVSEALADLDDDDKLKLTKDELDTLISNEGIKCSVDSRVQSLNLVSESGLSERRPITIKTCVIW